MCDQADTPTTAAAATTTTTKPTQENREEVSCEGQQLIIMDETNNVLKPQPHVDVKEASSCEIIAPHAIGGHTFLVTTVISETVTTTTTTETKENNTKHDKDDDKEMLKAVLVPPNPTKTIDQNDGPYELPSSAIASTSAAAVTDLKNLKAVVPISSSLPSKLLRFHAKRSAHALQQQAEQQQSESLDSQFGSDEDGACGGGNSESSALNEEAGPSAPSMMPPLSVGEDEKLIDVGMGSSIEDSEESEEDDELKPLAVDNHMLLLDIDIGSPTHADQQAAESSGTSMLSEANLEKFHQNSRQQQQQQNQHPSSYHQMDNIYLHPNFRYELDDAQKDISESSPPPAVAPANSPIEQRRVHRSFLTMKKPVAILPDLEPEKANSVNSINSQHTDQHSEQATINEIDTLDPELVPSDELAAEIAEAVEFYFSNESILKDAFLLKHVRRNKEGYVSLKLVSSFKRVRQLTKDWKVVGNAVQRKSQKIELNDIGTKVRRLAALPNFDETMPSRTIVACDLPLDKLTIEKVSDIFSKCGEIALIRILKPGMAIPVDVRQFMNKFPEMQLKDCALVEFLESSSARQARDLQGSFQVYEMVAPKKKTGKKAVIQVATPVARMVENYRYYNDATYERTRGGSFSGVMPHHESDLRFKLKRNNSDFNPKAANTAYADMQHQQQQYYQQQHYQPQHHQLQQQHQPHHQLHQHQPYHNPTHRGSFGIEHNHQYQNFQPRGSISHEATTPQSPLASPSGNNMNFFAYSPRRYSNVSTISANTAAAMNDSPSTTSGLVHSNVNGNNNNHNSVVNSNNGTSVRRISNCSDSYSNYSNSEMSRRPSNCSENGPQRRDSNCSENCPCSRRVSDFATTTEVYRKTSQGSIGSGLSGGGGGGNSVVGVSERNMSERRFSNGSMQFERTFSTGSDMGSGVNGNSFPRRMSNDFNYERRQSLETQTGSPYDDGNVGGGGGGYMVFPRRYSNNFNNVSSKLAQYDNAQYINGRRISTDSGYDRRYSFGSEYEGSPRSRTGSFLNNYKNGIDLEGQPRSRTNSFLEGSPRSRSGSFAQRNAENLVRTPLGPDGSKGFNNIRARKFGQTISPV